MKKEEKEKWREERKKRRRIGWDPYCTKCLKKKKQLERLRERAYINTSFYKLNETKHKKIIKKKTRKLRYKFEFTQQEVAYLISTFDCTKLQYYYFYYQYNKRIQDEVQLLRSVRVPELRWELQVSHSMPLSWALVFYWSTMNLSYIYHVINNSF